MSPTRIAHWCLLAAVALALITAPLQSLAKQADEENLGKDYAADVEREMKVVSDPAVVERVVRVGGELAAIANKVEVPATYGTSEIYQFKYQFKVVEDKDVNAFSLPGGYIYVNTGLLDMVASDDELAGVLAHEIAHAAHHHMVQLLKKSSSVDKYVALIALAGILGNVRSRDLSNLLLGAQVMKIGKISGYTQEAERDADRTAVAYMARSKYNPEGMLSFMKKLEAKHDESPGLPLGIFQTHPAPYRRVTSIAKAMRAEGLEPDLRKWDDAAYARCEEVEGSSHQFQVVLGNRVLFRPAGMGGGPCSKDRADQIAKQINDVLEENVRPTEIYTDASHSCLLAKGREILRVEKEDLRTNPKGGAAVLDEARSALEYAVWADWLRNDCVAQEDEPDD